MMDAIPLPDITGDGSPHPLSLTPILAKWVQYQADPNNPDMGGASVRIGLNASVTLGYPMFKGSFQMFPPSGELYDLSKLSYYAATGAKLSVLYGS